MTADTGADHRAMLALQATVKDLSARLVALETARDALEESTGPSPVRKCEDANFQNPDMPSEADRAAMVKRLRDKTNQAARDNAEYHRKRAADREAGRDVS